MALIGSTFPQTIEVVLGPFWSNTSTGDTNFLEEDKVMCLKRAITSDNVIVYTEDGSTFAKSFTNRIAVRMGVLNGPFQ